MTDTGRVPILKIKDRRDIDRGAYELGNKTESNSCMFLHILFSGTRMVTVLVHTRRVMRAGMAGQVT